MKRWMFGLLCSAIVVLIGASFTVAAEIVADPSNDVWHHPNNGVADSWGGTVADKPNLDITSLTATINQGTLTLNISVAGSIESSNVFYNATCTTEDTTFYIRWGNGQGQSSQVWQNRYTSFGATFNVSGNTISAIFKMGGNPDKPVVDLWGTAVQYTDMGPGYNTKEYWEDWAPNSHVPSSVTSSGNTGDLTNGNTGNTTNPNPGTNGNTGDISSKKTPGFELLPVLAAVGIAVLLVRERRRQD